MVDGQRLFFRFSIYSGVNNWRVFFLHTLTNSGTPFLLRYVHVCDLINLTNYTFHKSCLCVAKGEKNLLILIMTRHEQVRLSVRCLLKLH